MTLTKGTLIKEIKRNELPEFKDTIANSELTYIVERVNRSTYSLKCIEGYMKGSGCYLRKNFQSRYVNVYGTVTEYVVL